MTILGIAALIVLVVFGVMVLRVKSDPMENRSVRKFLADSEPIPDVASPGPSQGTDSASPGPTAQSP